MGLSLRQATIRVAFWPMAWGLPGSEAVWSLSQCLLPVFEERISKRHTAWRRSPSLALNRSKSSRCSPTDARSSWSSSPPPSCPPSVRAR